MKTLTLRYEASTKWQFWVMRKVAKALIEGILRHNDGADVVCKVTINKATRQLKLTVPCCASQLVYRWMQLANGPLVEGEYVHEAHNELVMVLHGGMIIMPFSESNPHMSRLVNRNVPYFPRRKEKMERGGEWVPPVQRQAIVEK